MKYGNTFMLNLKNYPEKINKNEEPQYIYYLTMTFTIIIFWSCLDIIFRVESVFKNLSTIMVIKNITYGLGPLSYTVNSHNFYNEINRLYFFSCYCFNWKKI